MLDQQFRFNYAMKILPTRYLSYLRLAWPSILQRKLTSESTIVQMDAPPREHTNE